MQPRPMQHCKLLMLPLRGVHKPEQRCTRAAVSRLLLLAGRQPVRHAHLDNLLLQLLRLRGQG